MFGGKKFKPEFELRKRVGSSLFLMSRHFFSSPNIIRLSPSGILPIFSIAIRCISRLVPSLFPLW
ncbi:MAG: hypothetical protein DRJ08_00105 [Acidobacteria bacterium]|nr:MAG: hypothetical protein DRJ08_00105 [Acidobacteriota bacterium]